jgi:NitT/TauT family transport system substrate-binding protein
MRRLAALAAVLLISACTPAGGGPMISAGSPVPASAPPASASGSGGLGGSPTGSAPESNAPSGPPTHLVVGLGFIPSVQFAQFYLADEAGYYREAGLEVEFQNKIDPDLITLLGQGAVDIGMADGTSVIPAVSQDIPVRYAATVYARFPSVVYTKAASGVREPGDLAGRKIGTPGRFGSSWIMLQALLASAGLTPDDTEIVLFPDFVGQRVALEQGVVDAATGFVNNEPVQMTFAGEEVVVLAVDEVTPLPGPGLVAGAPTLAAKRDALRSFVAATIRSMEEIRTDPERGLDAAITRVPELGADRDLQRAILEATIATWLTPYTETHGLGAIDRDAWRESVDFMRSLPDSPVAREVGLDELVTEELLPQP